MTMFSRVPEGRLSHENSGRQQDLRIVHGVPLRFRVTRSGWSSMTCWRERVGQSEEGGASEVLLPPTNWPGRGVDRVD